MDWAVAVPGFFESPENILFIFPQIEDSIWMAFKVWSNSVKNAKKMTQNPKQNQ